MNDVCEPKHPPIHQFHQAHTVAAARDKVRRVSSQNNELVNELHIHRSYLKLLNKLTSDRGYTEGDYSQERLDKEMQELENELRIEGCKVADERAKAEHVADAAAAMPGHPEAGEGTPIRP